jgi:adhesin transport system membrane fusion protein
MAKHDSEEELLDLAMMEERAGRSASRFSYLLSLSAVAALVTFVAWADRAVLDEVTRGTAQVIPSSRTQVIQNLEGGIVEEIHVEEGAIVQPGDLLLTIRNQVALSSFEDAKYRYLSLLAATARLEAEVDGVEPRFDKRVVEEAPELVAQEKNLYNARQRELQARIDLLENAVGTAEKEIVELQTRMEAVQDTLVPAKGELSLVRPLAARGIVPQVDVLRLEKEVASLTGEQKTLVKSIERAQSSVEEAVKRVQEVYRTFEAEAQADLNDKQVELASVDTLISAEQDRVRRTEVRSPVRGTVKQLYKTTLGGVLRPGETIMEIVPLDDTLLVEAEIPPQDIAFLNPLQKAVVKMTAYDFSIYGSLEGEVERISADTIVDEEGRSFYHVYVRTKKNSLEHEGDVLPIIPGMTAQVDILTGRKTVLEYLTNPIVNWREEALKER